METLEAYVKWIVLQINMAEYRNCPITFGVSDFSTHVERFVVYVGNYIYTILCKLGYTIGQYSWISESDKNFSEPPPQF
jgi:hypothetical protein